MNLRKQTVGSQRPWTIEELKSGLEHFYKENNRYPTAPEVDRYPYLPSARTIERSHGGLVSLRKSLGLGENYDFRTGDYSSDRAKKINARSHKSEQEINDFLIKNFGKQFVHREYFFVDDRRTRADFFVYDSKNGFCVDTFYPNDFRNLVGCINSKLRKYVGPQMSEYPVIFLQMNKDISQERIDKFLKNKKNKLKTGQYLMGWEAFKEFCKNREALRIESREN